MFVFLALLIPAVASLIAIIVWATGVWRATNTWLATHRRPKHKLDPDGEDADWGL